MALNGTPREETDRYLSENFTLADSDGLLDEVYAERRGLSPPLSRPQVRARRLALGAVGLRAVQSLLVAASRSSVGGLDGVEVGARARTAPSRCGPAG